MDIEQLELATRAIVPACDGKDQRLDVVVTLLTEILRELQMLRESLDLRNIEEATAEVRVISAAETPAAKPESKPARSRSRGRGEAK